MDVTTHGHGNSTGNRPRIANLQLGNSQPPRTHKEKVGIGWRVEGELEVPVFLFVGI